MVEKHPVFFLILRKKTYILQVCKVMVRCVKRRCYLITTKLVKLIKKGKFMQWLADNIMKSWQIHNTFQRSNTYTSGMNHNDSIVEKRILAIKDRLKFFSFHDIIEVFQQAATEKNEDLLLNLFSHKDISIKKTNWNNETILYPAIQYGFKKTCLLLIQRGIDVNSQRSDGQTALHWAVLHENREIIELLINNGADVNVQDKRGRTPLHLAIDCYDIDTCYLLIQMGARVDIKDSDGKTPLQYPLPYWLRDEIVNYLNSKNDILEQ